MIKTILDLFRYPVTELQNIGFVAIRPEVLLQRCRMWRNQTTELIFVAFRSEFTSKTTLLQNRFSG
jgi:hypothetical protein